MAETLAHDWRRRMAARSSLCAVLLAVPVGVSALIGFAAGPGALPSGLDSLFTGPAGSVPDSVAVTGPTRGLSRLAAGPAAPGPALDLAAGGSAVDGGDGGPGTGPGGESPPGVTLDPPSGPAPPPDDGGGPGDSPTGPTTSPTTVPTTPPSTPGPGVGVGGTGDIGGVAGGAANTAQQAVTGLVEPK